MSKYRLECRDNIYTANWDFKYDHVGSIFCPAVPGHQRIGARRKTLRVSLQSPSVGDLIALHMGELLVTERLKREIESADLTGCYFWPTDVTAIEFETPPGFVLPILYELRISGWGGMARPESGISLKYECPSCGHLVYSTYRDAGQLFDEVQWDGSDFFMIWPLPAYRFVTERVRRFFIDREIQSGNFVRIEQMQSPLTYRSPIEGMSPGRLSFWLPDELAHKYGDPLGIY